MEFYFPARHLSPARLAEVFEPAAHGLPGEFPVLLQRLSFSPFKGFFKGYIDLVFRANGLYYLLDWKTNFLGDRLADYRPANLQRTMAAEYYTWQYLLYTVALDRYLSLRDPTYRYDRHFGGVLYLFIRGVDADSGPGTGIYHDIPHPDTIRRLGQALVSAPRAGP